MHLDYRRDIDGLRAVAVLMVLAFHAFPALLPGGFLGVDIFFVISGYLITSDAMKRREARTFTLSDFYRRRARRLLPALSVVLAATLAFGSVVLYSDELEQLQRHVLASGLFAQNFRLLAEAGYFDAASTTKPLLHLWSLAIEEQFYLIWPLALGLLKARRAVLVTALAAVVLSAVTMHALESEPALAYYLPFTRLWQIMAGATLALLPAARLGSWAAHCMGLVGLSLCLMASATHSVMGDRMLLAALVPTTGAVLCIAAGPDSIAARLLGRPMLVWLGLLSYPLYLWHWPLLSYLHILAPVHSPAAVIAALIAALVLAELTRRYVETPLRRPWVTPSIGGTAASLAGGIAVMAVTGLLLLFPLRQPPAGEVMLSDLNHRRSGFYPCDAKMWAPAQGLMACLQSAPGRPSAVIIGDSHADHLFDGIAEQDARRNWLLIAQASCPPIVGVEVKLLKNGCGGTLESVLERIAADPVIRDVVLAQFGTYAAATNYAAGHVGSGPAQVTMSSPRAPGAGKEELLRLGLGLSVERLRMAGKRVAIVLDVPELPFQPRDCAARPLMQAAEPDCSVSRGIALERQRALRAAATDLERRHPDVRAFDPLNILCADDRCAVERTGRLLFKDSHHLSHLGSRLIGSDFLAWLDSSTGADTR